MKAVLLAGLVILVDQVSKAMAPPPGVWNEEDVYWNADLMFGIPLPDFLAPMLLVFCVMVAINVRPWWAASIAVGGGLSNFAERMWYGAVRDPFPAAFLTWNFADVAIILGLLLGDWKTDNQGEEVTT